MKCARVELTAWYDFIPDQRGNANIEKCVRGSTTPAALSAEEEKSMLTNNAIDGKATPALPLSRRK